MPEIIIDKEFMFLLPVLDELTYALLEENIQKNGCVHPIVLWKNIIIDGHNRYEICTKHGIPFETVNKEFDNRDDVIIWIISTQITRRNLTPIQLSFFRGMHYNADKRLQGTDNQYSEKSEKRHNDVFQKSTAKRLAEQYKVSSRTIDRDAKVADALVAIGKVSPDAKRDILSGNTVISRKDLRKLAGESEDEIAEATVKIKDGTFMKEPADSKTTGNANTQDSQAHGNKETLESVFSQLSKGFITEFQTLSFQYKTDDIKTMLRAHINELEILYKAISSLSYAKWSDIGKVEDRAKKHERDYHGVRQISV